MIKHVHFIGICGAGMSAVALLLKELGWQVTGSDSNFYPPISIYIANSGITFFKGYRKENIPANADLIIIGKHAELTPELNEEVRFAFESGKAVKSFAEVLGEITRDRDNIVVTGSYGKSTCTALLAWCLGKAGKKPGYFIGAIPVTPNSSSGLGQGESFVLEGDEYPSANWDNSSKFLYYHPTHLLLTSLAHDHINIFKTVEDYRVPFKKLLGMVPENGSIVACADGDGVIDTINSLKLSATFYSVKDTVHPWHVKNISYGATTSFDVFHKDEEVAKIKTELLGQHNIENILGVGALLLSNNLITPEQLADGIGAFKPPQRRLNKISDQTQIPIYEGFGSSHDKAVSAISAIKLHYPDKKLVVLFEPHTFSWRTREALSWYDTAFKGADSVLIYKPPLHGAAPDQLRLEEMVTQVKKQGLKAIGFESPEEGLNIFQDQISEDSVILVLSSGSFDGMINLVKKVLEDKFLKR